MGKYFPTIFTMACMKSLLMLYNFVFWISGIAILITGIWMKVHLWKYMEMSTEFSSTAPYVLIGLGALIILTASFACCCTIKGQPVLLYVYSGFLAIIFVLELGAGISIFANRNKLSEGFDNGLNQAMINYRNHNTTSADDFDLIQETLHCCGIRNANDWTNMDKPIPIPTSCCKKSNCSIANGDEYYTEGCYEKVVGFLSSNIGLVATIALILAIFPINGLILSCCLANMINKAKYEQMA